MTTVPHDTPDAGAPKAAWRAWARTLRRAWAAGPQRASDERAMALHLAEWQPWRAARRALVYVAFGDEPDPLRSTPAPDGDPARAGRMPRLATTRTADAERRLDIFEFDPTALERHALGFAQPRADAHPVAVEEIDLVLVPGLAFDERGGRLGYGRGFYDRLLARLPRAVPFVGVTTGALVVAELPCEPHDVPVGWLLTEGGVRRVGG